MHGQTNIKYVFRQLYVKHYTVKALIAECIISIKLQSRSFPDIRLRATAVL